MVLPDEAGFRKDLADDFRNHVHANVFAQAFGRAVAEVARVAPVAAGRERLRVIGAFFVEQGRLGEGKHVGGGGLVVAWGLPLARVCSCDVWRNM